MAMVAAVGVGTWPERSSPMPDAGSADTFLPSRKPRPWSEPTVVAGITPIAIYLPDQAVQVEVAYAVAPRRPKAADVRKVWTDRWRKRPSAVLLVVAWDSPHGRQASVVGLRDDPLVATGQLATVERAVAKALEQGAAAGAEAILADLLREREPDAIPGLDNAGLFATHELLHNVPQRTDWAAATKQAGGVRGRAGKDVLSGLGWALDTEGADYLLGSDGKHEAVAVVLEGQDVFDRSSPAYHGSTPVEHALGVAHRHNVRWVLVVKGTVVRLYTADPDTGIARKGTATYTEIDLTLLPDAHLGYVGLLLTPTALRAGGTVAQILASSADHAADLGARLRQRVYDDVIPHLATTIAQKLRDMTEPGLETAYHVTLVILFRLLFVAYAEDRGLLPYRTNEAYRSKALKSRARRYADLIAEHEKVPFDPKSAELWHDLQDIWRGIYSGNREWSIPAYGGSLFDPKDDTGAIIAGLTLTNRDIGPAVQHMLVDSGPDGTQGPVDFQTLSVREFGTIYEGLLESSLSQAPVDLALDKANAYVPAKNGDVVVAPAGSVYFHNSSGVRKATGSYFTKQFAVEHLLRSALDPTLDEHLAAVTTLLEDGQEVDAAEKLFDFRVADLAMGSGHFLVGAVDHIGARFAAFLDEHPIPHVTAELDGLRNTAVQMLERAGVQEIPQIDQMGLVRRQVARRCIYGIDLNTIAVDLARLAVWIHTFIPGLPMSTLDHGLVVGNSLTGIGTLDEAIEVLDPDTPHGQISLFRQQIEDGMLAGTEPLRRLALLSESTVAESREAASLIDEATIAIEPTKHALDAAVAGRLGLKDLKHLSALGWDAVIEAGGSREVQAKIEDLGALHFPVAFPEVFSRERPGFDVILGNPPWEKVKVEKHGWWGLRFPGLRSMSQKDKNAALARYERQRPDLVAEYESDVAAAEDLRDVLKAGPYPIGSGDTDLYKIFCWRDWALLREGGRVGVVFPRGALSGSGTAQWRETILRDGAFDDVCFLANNRWWVFDDVDVRYTIALTTIRRSGDRIVKLNGPFHSLADYRSGRGQYLTVAADEFATWATGAAFPLLPSNDSAGVFATMRRSPRFDSTDGFEFRPVAELHTSANKDLYDFDVAHSRRSVPILTGASFNIWDPDFGPPYAMASRREVEAFLQKRRQRQINDSRSAFFGLGSDWARSVETLPLRSPRIAFRDVARATDTRTVIAALIPPGCALVEKAPYLFGVHASHADSAYILGVMSSIPFDWFARRFVELKTSYGLLMAFPVPRAQAGDSRAGRVTKLAGTLAAVDDRYSDWAAEVGIPVGSVSDNDTKNDMIAEIDALVSHLYGLGRDDITHIFATFHRGWDYQPRLTAVLEHFDRWADKK